MSPAHQKSPRPVGMLVVHCLLLVRAPVVSGCARGWFRAGIHAWSRQGFARDATRPCSYERAAPARAPSRANLTVGGIKPLATMETADFHFAHL